MRRNFGAGLSALKFGAETALVSSADGSMQLTDLDHFFRFFRLYGAVLRARLMMYW
jgi:hypothetical protein